MLRFLWPFALLGLLVPLLMVAAYFLLRRRRRKFAVTYASLSLIKQAMPERSRWRRLVPAALLLAAIVALVVAMARPQALVATTRSDTSIMLTIDVSRSMCSTDVRPNRLSAAQDAARKFVDNQPGGTRLGIVVFAAGAQILVPPTTDRDRLNRAIDGFNTSLGTAIGNGVLAAIDALSRVNPDIAPSTVTLSPAERRQDRFASRYVPDLPSPLRTWEESKLYILERLMGKYEYGDGRVEQDPNYMIYSNRNANYPHQIYAKWFLTQFRRWGQVKGTPDYSGVAKRVMRADLYVEAMKELGLQLKVAEEQKVTLFDGVMDGANPEKYATSFAVHSLAG